MRNTNTNYEVKNIKKALKKGFCVVSVKYPENEVIYTPVRKQYTDKNEKLNFALYQGKKIYFNDEYEFVKMEDAYEVKGVVREGVDEEETKDYVSFVEEVETTEEVETPEETEEITEEVEEVPEETTNIKNIVAKINQEIESKQVEKNVRHKEMDTIKTCVEAGIPVYLTGPAGSGKNYTIKNIANELGLEFYFTNSVQQEYKLTGFIDAGGKYHETEFYKAFKDGGLFFLDEMDASIPEVLILLNAAIANGYFEFPNGRIDANENFRVIAAGNTIGRGADEQYTGRMVLDAATLDRFVVIEFDYDERVELSIAKGDKELMEFIHMLREYNEMYNLGYTYSYRCIEYIVKLNSTKMALEKILMIAIFKGMKKEDIATIQFKNNNNKYAKAATKMAA